MRRLGLLLAALLAFGALTPTPAPPSAPVTPGAALPVQTQTRPHHLVYRFGYNTRATDSGTGTGTTTIDILGQAKDGGVMIKAADFIWNTVRPRAANTCEVYANGSTVCAQPPYALSLVQVTIFPLLARGYFAPLAGNANATWSHAFQIQATFAPSLNAGFFGQVYTWKGSYNLTGKGPSNQPQFLLVSQAGKFTQQGGRAISFQEQANILWDPAAGVPVFISEQRTFYPQHTVYNNDYVELRLETSEQNAQ
jgi:hypothetical protein